MFKNLKFGTACGNLDLFSPFFEKFNNNSSLTCLPQFPSNLHFFRQFAVSEHRADFCKVRNCQYLPLIYDETLTLSSFNIDLNCDSSYQSTDCCFTTFKDYFRCTTQIRVFVFQKLISAIDFHRSLKIPVLTILSFTKKRLLRKEFRTKRKFCQQSEPSYSRSDQRASLLLKISSILQSKKRQEIQQIIFDLSPTLH